VLGERIILRFAFVIANQLVKDAAHACHVGIQPFGQRRPVIHAHPPGQTRAIKVIARQGLRLLVVDALQQVFQTAQEQIGLAQGLRVAFRQQVQLLNGAQRRQQRAGLQRRLAPAANQLEDLNDKFDFTNAARAELDVVFQPRRRTSRAIIPFMLRRDWITLKSI
jgi:hypothetical protein